MSDPILDGQIDVYSMVPRHLFIFQKMLAVTNFPAPVTKPPLNALRTTEAVQNHPAHLHSPHCIVDKEKAVFGTAEKYYETAPTFSVYLFGLATLLKVLLNH